MSRVDLATRQAALVAALVSGAAVPAGFDPMLLRAAATVLLHKRARQVAGVWPALRAEYGPRWLDVFSAFAAGRPAGSPLLDGWDLARAAPTATEEAAIELARCEARWRYVTAGPPRLRRLPTMRRTHRTLVFQFAGCVWTASRGCMRQR